MGGFLNVLVSVCHGHFSGAEGGVDEMQQQAAALSPEQQGEASGEGMDEKRCCVIV